MQKFKCFLSYASIPLIVPALFFYTIARNLKFVPKMYTFLRLQRIDANNRLKFIKEMKGVS